MEKEVAPVRTAFQESLTRPGLNDLFKKLNAPSADESQPRITFLGTQSMKPGILRNVSAIHLQVDMSGHRRGIMLDCGENTYGQLLDIWSESTPQKLREIKLIYITHAHADHQIGVCRLLAQIEKAHEGATQDWSVVLVYPLIMTPYVVELSNLWLKNPNRVKHFHSHLFNPEGTQFYYENALIAKNPDLYSQSVALESEESGGGKSVKEVDLAPPISKEEADARVKALYEGANKSLKQFSQFVNQELGIKYFYVAQNDHMIESYGGILEFESGFKLSYSGDTRPCQNLVNYARGSDVLIHESTFGRDHDKDAVCKKHSTNDEAVGVGVRSNSTHTVLTHFSSRYEKLPDITSLMREKGGMVAFDYLSVTPEQLKKTKEFLESVEGVSDVLFLKA